VSHFKVLSKILYIVLPSCLNISVKFEHNSPVSLKVIWFFVYS